MNIKVLIENMVDRERLIPSLFILTVSIFFYLFKLDYFLSFLIFILIMFDLHHSKLINTWTLKLYTFVFILFLNYFIFYSHHLNDFFLYFISFILIFIIFFLKKFFKLIVLTIFLFYFYAIFKLILFNINFFFLIILLSFINDSTAFLFGKYIKGPTIIPSISPNKTWSGTLISFLLSTFLFLLFEFNLIHSIAFSFSFFVCDIYFSYIKRRLKIKDFSTILLGHGGILDRLDSMFFLIIFNSFSILL